MRPSDTFFAPLRRWGGGMTQWLSIPMSRKSRYQMTPSAIVRCRKQDLSTRLEFIGVRGFSKPQKPSRKSQKRCLLPEKCFRRHTGTISKLTFVEGDFLKIVYVCALLRSFRNLQSEGKCIHFRVDSFHAYVHKKYLPCTHPSLLLWSIKWVVKNGTRNVERKFKQLVTFT